MQSFQNILLISVLSLLLQSCFINRYQKVQTTWEKAQLNTSEFITPDSILKVNYSMWDSQSAILVKIQNRTDSQVYINPWYTFEIVQHKDTNFLELPNRVAIKKNNGSVYIAEEEMAEMLYYGDEIPIPPKGVMEIKSACINCYLQLDYEDNDPASTRDFVTYTAENTPFHYERRIGYAFPSDTNLRVVRHIGYVSTIDRYRFVWQIEDIPADKKEDRSFYVHSIRPSVITWLGMVGLGVVYVLGAVSGDEE